MRNTRKTLWLSGLVLFLAASAAHAVEIGDSGYGFGIPLAVQYSMTRKVFGSAGVILGRTDKENQELVGWGESVYGLLLDGTVGQNDYSYSIGYGGGTSIGLIGAAIRATTLVGRSSDDGYFLERNQKAYGIELSAGLGLGLRVGVFRTEKTHTTKFITSIGFGF